MTLKIDKISKRFGNDWVLRDISFEVEKGEIFGIFGASGSGKSVLLNIVAGEIPSNGGAIYDNSVEVSKFSAVTHGFQTFPNHSNSFWRNIFGAKGNSARTDSAGTIAEFEAVLEKADGVLILDDPLCRVDSQKREGCLEKLRQTVKAKNLKVIFATNDPAQIFDICDRLGILENKEILQIGTPREIYEAPNSGAAAVAIGRINLIAARRLSKSNSEIPEFQTIIGEHRLFTQKTEKRLLGAINQNISLGIRPEHISLSFGASFPEDNLLKAEVSGVKYQGATTLVELSANGLTLHALVLRLVGLKIGDECMVGLPPDRILVLKD